MKNLDEARKWVAGLPGWDDFVERTRAKNMNATEQLLHKYPRGTLLYNIPLPEFETGGLVDSIYREAGYEESGHVVVGVSGHWGLTVGEAIEFCRG